MSILKSINKKTMENEEFSQLTRLFIKFFKTVFICVNLQAAELQFIKKRLLHKCFFMNLFSQWKCFAMFFRAALYRAPVNNCLWIELFVSLFHTIGLLLYFLKTTENLYFLMFSRDIRKTSASSMKWPNIRMNER